MAGSGFIRSTIGGSVTVSGTVAVSSGSIAITGNTEPDLAPDATESALAAGVFAPGAAIATLVAGGVYFLELWPDPNAGASLSEIVWGRYELGSAPGSDTGGLPIVTGMTRRICSAAGADLYVRKHSQTDFACRFVLWRKDA